MFCNGPFNNRNMAQHYCVWSCNVMDKIVAIHANSRQFEHLLWQYESSCSIVG